MKKYYKNNVGSIGYYEDGVLNCLGYRFTENLENLIEATPEEIKEYLKEKEKLDKERQERKKEIEKRAKEIEKLFGLDPRDVGLRHRNFWIIKEPDPYSYYEKKEYLCVEARDGGSNEPDCTVGKYPNYVGSECDSFDITYRYYYFKPLKEEK